MTVTMNFCSAQVRKQKHFYTDVKNDIATVLSDVVESLWGTTFDF